MPYLAPGFAFDSRALDELAERRRSGLGLRTLLAGSFAESGSRRRAVIEDILAEQTSGWRHTLVPEWQEDEREIPPEIILAEGGADLVLVDLDGPVGVLLALVGRLRVAAGESVAFVGVMPRGASQVAQLYLPAVLDAVIPGPLGAASLHWAVTDALQSMPMFVVDAHDAMTQGLVARH